MEDSIYYDVQRLSKVWFFISVLFVGITLYFAVSGMLTEEYGFIFALAVTLLLFALALLDIYAFLILKLTIVINAEFLYITMLPFFAVKIPVETIYLTEVTKYRRFIDYRGLGLGNISGSCDPAYFLKGGTGVRIYYPESKIIIGAADPKKLINAVQYAQQRKRILSEMD
jgi:hypothetical protein